MLYADRQDLKDGAAGIASASLIVNTTSSYVSPSGQKATVWNSVSKSFDFAA